MNKVTTSDTNSCVNEAKMLPSTVDIVIVGAGLSGIVAASQLGEEVSFVILEARDRVGGRLLTLDGFVDMGAAWIWPSDRTLLAMIKKAGLERSLTPQFADGNAIQSLPDGSVMTGRVGRGESKMRLKCGTQKLVQTLADKFLPSERIFLNHQVTKITQDLKQEHVIVTVKGFLGQERKSHTITASRVILALPPQLAHDSICFIPELPQDKAEAMRTTRTWMADTGKVAVLYSEPFWRAKGFSGAIYSNSGRVPIREMWDNCVMHESADDDEKFALAGFIIGKNACSEALRMTDEELKEDVLKQLDIAFESKEHREKLIDFHVKVWLDDPLTSSATDESETSKGIEYGDQLLRQSFHRVHFAGTETEFQHGHMEGAVQAGLRAAQLQHTM